MRKMETVLFFYNILIMIAFTVCSIDFLVLYNKHRDKSQLMIAIVFFLFIFDNLLLYMYEFLPGFTKGYFIHTTAYEYSANLLSFLIIFSYRLTVLTLEKKALASKEIFLWGSVFIAILAVTALSDKLTAWIIRDIVMGLPAVGVFAHALYRHRKTGGFPKRDFVPEFGTLFIWASLVFELLNTAEGIMSYYGVFLLSPDRKLSIELLSVVYSGAALWFLMRNRFSAEKPSNAALLGPENEKELLERFGSAYGLTQRERDILDLLVQGYSNADICKAACISEGTVKTHTHNIYQKLDVKNRVQLGVKIKEFQKNGVKGKNINF